MSVQQPVIGKQSREIIYRVFQYFNNSKSESDTLECVKTKTSLATGISVRTIERIRKEADDSLKLKNKVEFSSPGKKRNRFSPVTALPAYRTEVIRRKIYDLNKNENVRVTTRTLLQKLREDGDFEGGETSLRKVLKTLGFNLRKPQNNRKLLIEKKDIRPN